MTTSVIGPDSGQCCSPSYKLRLTTTLPLSCLVLDLNTSSEQDDVFRTMLYSLESIITDIFHEKSVTKITIPFLLRSSLLGSV